MTENKKSVCTTPLKYIAKGAMVLAMCSLMLACGKKDTAEKASQSIASVNGDEITFLQLNDELQRARIKPEQQAQAEKQIVQKLIDRQLLVQDSLNAKLDRDPRIVQAIENAKMQILAQSYLESKAASISKPTDAEIADYRSNHADFFANRKIFIMEQLIFTASDSYNNELEALSDSAKTIEEVTKWLTEHQIKYAQNKAAHAAETLPPEFLNKINKMAIGELIFFKTNQQIMVARMADIQSKPISEADAKPIIERILLGQKRKQVAEAELNRLRAAAKITYINKKFEPASQSTNSTISKPTELDKQASEPSSAATPPKQKDGDKTADHIEKGISGL